MSMADTNEIDRYTAIINLLFPSSFNDKGGQQVVDQTANSWMPSFPTIFDVSLRAILWGFSELIHLNLNVLKIKLKNFKFFKLKPSSGQF